MKRQRFTSLLAMFNAGYDFGKLVAPGVLEGTDWPIESTHHLVCTAWDTPENKTLSENWRECEPGKARSVCAVPLKRKLHASRLVLRRPLPKSPKHWPVYLADAALGGKRKVLEDYARLTGTFRKLYRKIRKLDDAGCNALLKEFVKASRWMRAKQADDPETKRYWAERKLKMMAQKPKRPSVNAPAKRAKAQAAPVKLTPARLPAPSVQGVFTDVHRAAAKRLYAAVTAFNDYPDKKHKAELDSAKAAFETALPNLKDQRQIGVAIRREEQRLETITLKNS